MGEPKYATNWAAKPGLMDILCRIRWADWQATPPTVDMGDGEVRDIYSFLASIGRQESRAEIDAALAERFKGEEHK